ncbi:MAG: fibronectin type III domain-containing protein [Pseudomonadota bacterium]
MRADPPDGTIYTTGGTEFAFGGAIDPWGPALTEPVLEDICGLTGVTILEQNGANGTYSSDDYIGIRFTGTRAGQTHEYEFAFSGASGTQYIETQTLSTQAPTIAAAFSANPITGAQSSTLTLTLTNPNSSTALDGVAVAGFALPANLTGSAQSTTCSAGSVTYVGGTRTLSLSGASLAASASCTITLTVTPGLAGTYPITTGAVSSTTPATTGLTASASLGVAAVAPGAPTIGTATAGDASASVTFTAPTSTGGAVITGYTVTSSPGGLTGTGATSPVTVPGLTNGTAYTFTVQATNSQGSGTASAASNSVTPKQSQTITFANPGAQNFGTSPTFAPTASSALAVTLTSTTTGVCTVSGFDVTFVTTGTCTIEATQAGNGAYSAATAVQRSFSVNAVVPGAPTIGTATAGDTTASVTFTAPASSGGAAITGYTVTSSPGGLTGTGASSPVTVPGLTNGTSYTFTVLATNSAGPGTASAASNSVTPKAPQTITFPAPASIYVGAAATLTATATSGQAVTYTTLTPLTCSVAGSEATGLDDGTCTIEASQAGSAEFLTATPVTQDFVVNALTVPDAPTIGTATAGDASASVAFTAPASTGGAAITGYTVTSSPGGLTGTGASSPVTVPGLTNGTAYTFTVQATNSEGSGAASAASNSVTPKAPQTITLTSDGAYFFGSQANLAASTTSGLTLTFTGTPGIRTVAADALVTFQSTGTCIIKANQPGNTAYLPAAEATVSFSILATAPGAPTIGTATAGNTTASVTFTAPAGTGGAAITGYTVTSSPGGLTGSGASSPVTVPGLTNGTSYTFTVLATNSAGPGTASAASNSVTPKAPQTITFPAPASIYVGAAATLAATATSGQAVSYTTLTPLTCSVAGSEATGLADGTCTIEASQAGSAEFLAATPVTQDFVVNALTVPDAPTIGAATAGDASASVAFTAPASTGGAAITGYTVTSSPGGLTGTGASSPVTVPGLTNGTAYTFTVQATNSEGSGAASAASNSVTPKAPQTITLTSDGAYFFGSQANLAASTTSGLTLTFTGTPGIRTVAADALVTFQSTGTCIIKANQPGNTAYLPAAEATVSFSILATAPGAPTIGTATAGDTTASVTFTAPASSGGAAITGYTVTSSPGGLTGTGASSPVTVPGLTNGTAYTFTVQATNSQGDGTASAASNSVTPKADQTITFANPGAQDFGTTSTLAPTASSMLAVTLTSTTTGVCTVSGFDLTFVSAGTCTIEATQAGNAAWNAATAVQRSFTVNAVAPDAPTITSVVAGDTSATIAFTTSGSMGGSTLATYTVTSTPESITRTGATSPITVSGLTNGTTYTFTVRATSNAALDSAESADSDPVTPTTSQSITFVNPGTRLFGTSPTLSPTASSGLPVTLTSITTDVCTVSGYTLTFVSAGRCRIEATQAGDAAFLEAGMVIQGFDVSPVVPSAPVIGAAAAGTTEGSAIVTFTAPANTGGVAITGYTVTSTPPAGLTVTGTTSPLTVSGLTPLTTYTFTVLATNEAGDGPASAATNSVKAKASQTITFANPGTQTLGTVAPLVASTSAGVTPVLTSTTPAVCAIASPAIALIHVAPGSCTVEATDPGDSSYLAAVPVSNTFTINPALVTAVDVPTRSLTMGQPVTAFVPVTATGGTPTVSYATSPALPVGLTMDASSGAISGIPTEALATAIFTVTVTDGVGVTATGQFALTVNDDVTATTAVSTVTLTEDLMVAPFIPVTASGGTGPLTYAIAPALPDGVSFNTATGGITGTPTTASAQVTHTVTVTDANSQSATGSFDLTIAATLVATVEVPTTIATPGEPLAFTPITATGGVGVLTYAIAPALPDGVSFNTATGEITGTPTMARARVTHTVTVTDANSQSATGSFDLTIAATLVATVEVPTTIATPGEPLAFTPVTATGGVGVLTYAIAPALPDGVSFNTATGEVTGTPTGAVDAVYTVTVSDEASDIATGTFSLLIAAVETTLALTADTSSAVVGDTITLTATLSGGASPSGTVTFALGSTTLGTVPLSGVAATFTHVVTEPGTTTFTATYSGDAVNPSASGSVTVSVAGLVVEAKLIQTVQIQRMTSLILQQPDITGFLNGTTQQPSLTLNVSGKNGQIDWFRPDGPLWFRLTASRTSDDDGNSSHYALLSFGKHMKLGENALIGLMGQVDSIGTTAPVGTASGTGWQIGPYAATRLGELPLYLDARYLWGRTDNLITPTGAAGDQVSGTRDLAMVKLSGSIPGDRLSFRPYLSYSRATETTQSYTSSGGASVPKVNIALTQAALGFDFSYVAPIKVGSLNFDGGLGWAVTDDTADSSATGTSVILRLGVHRVTDDGTHLKAEMFGQGAGSADAATWGVNLGLERKF